MKLHEKLSIDEEKKATIQKLEILMEKIKKDEFKGFILATDSKSKQIETFGIQTGVDEMIQSSKYLRALLRKNLEKEGVI